MTIELATTQLTNRSGTAGPGRKKLAAPSWCAAASVALLCIAQWSCGGAAGDQPTAAYDEKTGQLRALAFDMDKNGKNDTVLFMDGGRIRRVELDLNENGKVERWDFYDEHGKLEKVGLSQRDDGVMDAEAFYTDAGVLSELRISTKRDGRYDRTEYYDNNVMVRSADDTDGDGRPDKWDTYRPDPHPAPGASPYAITSTAIDDAGAGRPTRRFIYGDHGAVARVEVDRVGDGVFVPVQPSSSSPSSSRGAR